MDLSWRLMRCIVCLQDKIEELQNKLTVLQAQRTQLTSRSHMLATARQVLYCLSPNFPSHCRTSTIQGQDKTHSALFCVQALPERCAWLF